MRLGLGKGYYDRFFAHHPDVLRVGVVFHVQVSSHPLPADSWDQAMDWIVSEKMILRVNARNQSPGRFHI
jgi:5-formyltetrahydrofolate cyclo-ligase